MDKAAPLATNLLSKIPGTGALGDIASKGASALGDFIDNSPKIGGGVSTAIEKTGSALQTGLNTALDPATYWNAVKSGAVGLKNFVMESYAPKTEDELNSIIDRSYSKAIKPSARNNPSLFSRYMNGVRSVVKDITANIADISGGELPNSVASLRDAVESGMANVYKAYASLTSQAGEKGAVIDMTPIANELDTVINSKALSIQNPSAIQYAQALQKRLIANPSLDVSTAEQLITGFNSELKTYYRNPTYGMGSNAAIDAGVVNNLRKALDTQIQNATGEAYQPLKNLYGAYSEMQPDVMRAFQRLLRKNSASLLDFTDIFTGGEMLSGLLKGSPIDAAVGLGSKGIEMAIKKLNDPNTAIESMFSGVANAIKNGVIKL
jgi:hypothetical protein